ncbi:S1C family serine protease [Paenibacillus arenosi]|uniref:Trypsin-like peptidase domain-containing protein n=1 Tax=Paenibacillus arenosi TaxID=2774142 RepID=A0ABR9B0G5_9BACL|nr:trypsin-like peptidase domain-containing protein [Paenibacillus arenosi]MBD8499814.1 trypsin-like peptidase domain-containing protein [Paenibacillus arenosi]
MSDQRNSFSHPDKGSYTGPQSEANQAGHEQAASKEQDNKQQPYYYAYGPYQSSRSEQDSTVSRDSSGRASDVPVTPPQAIKPMPFSSATHNGPTFAGGASSNGGGGYKDGERANQQWQFQQKPERRRTSFRTVVASFMAGVIAIGGLMGASDYYNWFTGEDALLSGVTERKEAAQQVVDKRPAPFPEGTAAVSDVVKMASPAVVKIDTYGTPSSTGGRGSWMDDPFFRQFFGGNPESQHSNTPSEKALQPLGLGTGFIFEKDGFILTNQHVIEGAEVVQVNIEGYTKPFKAQVLGKSRDLDLAVLKIEGDSDFPTIKLGNSDATEVGEQLVAIGNPSGFDHTVTTGVLSARERSITVNDNGQPRTYEHLLQTDASINPGNSGGPLLNMKGEVIGMNVAVSKEAQGIGFAIPANVILNVVEPLKQNKEIPKEPVPFIGTNLITMTEEIAKSIGIENTPGALVHTVVFGSPAYDAELRAYDVITTIDGKEIATKEELSEQILTKKVGDTVKLEVVRKGKKTSVDVKIGDKNKFQQAAQEQLQP